MKQINKLYFIFIVISLSTFFISCKSEIPKQNQIHDQSISEHPKYIFLFIGDGMSFSQINIAKAAQHHKNFRLYKKPEFGNKAMNILEFPVTGIATTFASDRYITESAAAATALATGKKTSCGTVAKSPDHSENYQTIAEMARDKGMKVGIVSSVNIDHATPACFYAHEKDRGKYNSIASQMSSSNFDYFGGGFARGALPKNIKKQNAKNVIELMKKAGYKLTTTRKELDSIIPGQKCWAYNKVKNNDPALLYEIDQPADYIDLAYFTEKGIHLLDNDRGFFMMIESGKIDWACHANDAVSAAHEVVALDESVGKALNFYKKHPRETLIIVTGDHECGGLALGYYSSQYESIFEILNYQKISYEIFSNKVDNWKNSKIITQAMVLDSVKYYFGLGDEKKNKKLALSKYETKRLLEAYAYSFDNKSKTDDEEYYINYGGYDPLCVTVTHLLNQKSGIDWSTYSHTALPVPIYAIGVGANMFSGQLDNTDIGNKIMKLANLK